MSFALSIIAKTTIVLLFAAFVSLLFRRSSASSRHALWMLAIVSALLLPLVALFVPQMELPV